MTNEQKEKVHSYYIKSYKSKPHEWKEELRSADSIPCMKELFFYFIVISFESISGMVDQSADYSPVYIIE